MMVRQLYERLWVRGTRLRGLVLLALAASVVLLELTHIVAIKVGGVPIAHPRRNSGCRVSRSPRFLTDLMEMSA